MNIRLYLERVIRNLRAALLVTKPWFRRCIKAVWILTVCIIVGVPVYIYAVISNPYNLFGSMPTLKDIENPKNDLSSELISSDGVSLGRFFRFHRSAVSYDELSPELVKTLIVSEDIRFYEHSGMDLRSYLRVIAGILTFSKQGGGSTLTQQTAKNLFRTREAELQGKLAKLASPFEMLISKTKEWIIAVRLEQNFTKEEIIALYLNTVPFNNNAFGIKVAAETYFQKSPDKLNIQESALLVGMLQGTSIYNPITHPERAIKKRNEVLNKLFKNSDISTKQKLDSLKALPLQLNFSVQNHNEGLAPYLRSILQNTELPVWCKDNGYDLFESGLKIYTTIDSRLQKYAEQAMVGHMTHLQKMFEDDWGNRNPWVGDDGVEIKNFVEQRIKKTDAYKDLVRRYGDDQDSINYYLRLKKRMKIFSWSGDKDTVFSHYDSLRYYYRFLHAGLMSVEPETGAVKAWVGGINHTHFQFDHVLRSKRQPGSTFKPFVYGLAIENGYSPCQPYFDISPTIIVNGKPYHAKNADGTYGDGKQYTIRQALARSLNSISIQLMDHLKPENVVTFARKVGITSTLDPVYSLALGTSDVSLYEMVGAYSTFVNQGIYIKPHYITRIEDKHGNVVASFIPQYKQVLDATTAYTIVHMLKGGVEEPGGSSKALSDEVRRENQIGGKTGTTDNGSDGWYMGITHNLVTGVWVGGDERSIHFPRWGEGSGGKAALPIWDKFMRSVYANPQTGYSKGHFKIPLEVTDTNFDCQEFMPEDSVMFVE